MPNELCTWRPVGQRLLWCEVGKVMSRAKTCLTPQVFGELRGELKAPESSSGGRMLEAGPMDGTSNILWFAAAFPFIETVTRIVTRHR